MIEKQKIIADSSACIAASTLLGAGMGGLTVLSLFDGMSCGQLALQKAGIKVKQYYAAEIDKYAIQVTQANFPDTIQLGDVTKVFAKDLPKIDLLIGGSPCQGFSFAGKMLNFKDPRSKLFFEFVRLKNECKPKWFFLENVQMPYEHELVISKYMGIEPIVINSRLLTAQNRVRNYWTNINEQPYGLFGDLKPNIPMPKDKKVLLHHITEPFASDKYLLSEKAIAKILRRNWSIPKIEPDKTGAILPKNNSGQLSVDSGTTLIRCVAMRGREACLSPKRTEYGKQIRKDYEAGKIKEQRKNIQQLEPRNDGKTNTLTSVQKDNLLQIGDKVRRLTELECERLQSVPDNYTNHVSSTQRYKMLGNGWTVDVIAYIFGFMKSELAKSAEW
jgi:DNA (cytosine-5)-methyltransferase 1